MGLAAHRADAVGFKTHTTIFKVSDFFLSWYYSRAKNIIGLFLKVRRKPASGLPYRSFRPFIGHFCRFGGFGKIRAILREKVAKSDKLGDICMFKSCYSEKNNQS